MWDVRETATSDQLRFDRRAIYLTSHISHPGSQRSRPRRRSCSLGAPAVPLTPPTMRPFPLLLAALTAAPSLLAAQAVDSATLAGMRWRSVGPAHFEGRIA